MIGPDAVGAAALLAVVLAGCATRLNVGVAAAVLALPLAWWAGLDLADLNRAVPWRLFVRLTAVTALFGLALANGTLDRLAWLALRGVGFRPGLTGPLVFVAAFALASSGAGNFAATAMIAPVAMVAAPRLGVGTSLMAAMVVYGATAGAFSPIAPTGVVAHTLLAREGIPHDRWALFMNGFAAHLLVAVALYVAARGWRGRPGLDPVVGDAPRALLQGLHPRRGALAPEHDDPPPVDVRAEPTNKRLPATHATRPDGAQPVLWVWTAAHYRTATVLAGFVALTLTARLPIEWGAGTATLLLVSLGAAARTNWTRHVPWRLIVMVCGVGALAAVVQQAGGLALLGRLLAAGTDPRWLPGALALVSGLVSVAASSIGVVLPAFLPATRDVVLAAGGGNVTAVAFAVCIGAHLVDISPLSPLGALCVSHAPVASEQQALFRRLLVTGLVMCAVGALLCQAGSGFLW